MYSQVQVQILIHRNSIDNAVVIDEIDNFEYTYHFMVSNAESEFV